METNWAETELKGAALKDRRRVTSLSRAAAAIFEQPQLSLSAALGNGLRQAAGDLFQHRDTRVVNLIAGHVASTAERCREHDRVIVAQDTTYFTYGQDQIVGLGGCSTEVREGWSGIRLSRSARKACRSGWCRCAFGGPLIPWTPTVRSRSNPKWSAARAQSEVVQDYTLWWLIERVNCTPKSWLKAESLQIDDAHSLSHCLALYYIVAWRLLYITHLAREAPQAPPTTVLTELEVQVLEAISGKPVPTLEIAVREIAKLGGYEYYRNKRLPPGVKVMWWGLQRLSAMVIGWEAALNSVQPK